MANKIILKSGETIPTSNDLEELEPGIDKTTNKLYTKINGEIVSLNDTSWENIQNKPETFPPEEHTHEIIDIENLESEITLIKESIDGKMDSPTNLGANGQYLQRAGDNQGTWVTIPTVSSSQNGLMTTELYNTLNKKMDSPTNLGSSGQYLRRDSSNQGTWYTIPTVSSSQNGLMTTSLYDKLNTINRYVTIEGTSGVWTYRIWSDGFMELWASIYVSTSVSYTLGENWYRSDSPIGQREYPYPYSFQRNTYPNIQASFYSTNNQSALIWLNPTVSYRIDYAPSLYLIRPSTANSVIGYINFYISGQTNV